MALARRQPVFEDGLNKKHDLPTHNDRWKGGSRMSGWIGLRKRRLIISVIAFCAVYLFVKHLPTDVPPVGNRIDSRTGQSQGRNKRPYPPAQQEKISNDPPVPKGENRNQLYDGPVKFYNLASTLRSHLRFSSDNSHNVLFALHDLESASTLIPLACEMANFHRSEIHVAVMSRQEAAINEIMEISGIAQLECPVSMHDARPDYSQSSTPARRALSIKGALGHLNLALRPRVVVTDASHDVNSGFLEALQGKADELRLPVITLPTDALTSMHWISGLSANSLAQLDSIQIEILIHAQSESAGTIIGLLQSIQAANYAGIPWPKITIELPAHVDPFVLNFLDEFRWPPHSKLSENMLTVRRRIDTSYTSPVMASVRTLESFYPAIPSMSHVLVLSPDVELTSHYLQYLTFVLLEYRYGHSASPIPNYLMGISLELPEKRLDSKSKFWAFDKEPEGLFMLSQSPSSNAVLYFGGKWNELHQYLQKRLQRDSQLEKKVSELSEIVSKEYPLWLNLALEFMQARGYYILYPAFTRDQDLRLVTLHKELHRRPEEYAKLTDERKPDHEAVSLGKGDILTADEEAKHAHGHERLNQPVSLQSMLALKPTDSERKFLPKDLEVPLYSYSGELRDWPESTMAALEFAESVALKLGGCMSLKNRDAKKMGTVEHMFCDD